MKVIANDLWMCGDCRDVILAGDATSLDYYYPPEAAAQRLREIEQGAASQGGDIVGDTDTEGEDTQEFSWAECDCCGSGLGGARHRYAVLGG
jgi:hypothetical protein